MFNLKHLGLEKVKAIASQYPTPFHLYDEQGIVENAKAFLEAFAWNEGFKEYFAVKATPNPHIIRLLQQQGIAVDCSSLAELTLAKKLGMSGENIMFTSNNTAAKEFQLARELGAVINLDDIEHIAYLEKHAGLPELLSFRYNPGSQKTGNVIIGKPKEAKFGLTKEQLLQAYRIAKDKGVKRFGLHTMVASNELNVDYFIETAMQLFELALEIKHSLKIDLEFINLGGGLGIPYHPDDSSLDIQTLGDKLKELYDNLLVANGLGAVKLAMECGRYMTGPFGCLVTQVRHIKQTYKTYIGLDATMADLMRPGMYGAYHHVSVVGKESDVAAELYDLTGSLCENNDKFAIDRLLPKIEVGDYVVVHDTGAHGHAMGFNYNGKLRSAELLLQTDGHVKLIRRAETLDDYFATLEF